ncbi:MAG TPA: hypothetical protein VEB19_18370 [Gemmatimonadaceae bacterium]|nr:hypothetical protein [Gemmatimonadaceae bacterium]
MPPVFIVTEKAAAEVSTVTTSPLQITTWDEAVGVELAAAPPQPTLLHVALADQLPSARE